MRGGKKMPKKDLLSKISEELTKYRIVVKGLSILPLAFHFSIVYLPTNEEVGYIKWTIFQGITGEIMFTVDGKKYYLKYKDNQWTISEG
jgi:hypothetical protein